MADIWSGIGVEISQKSEGEWLYRSHGETRGPVPAKVIASKLANGELDLETYVGKEGGEFHPITRVAAFATHVTEAKKQAHKRAAQKRKRIIMIITLPVLGAMAAAGYFIYEGVQHTRAENERQRLLAEEELKKKRELAEKAPDAELVALVSLGTEDSVKIKNQAPPPSTKKPPPSTKSKVSSTQGTGTSSTGTSSTGTGRTEPEEMVATCKLSQGEIFGTLKKSLGKINVCVENEKATDTEGLLPPMLELSFVVQTSGKVTDFEINDRHYRKGTLNNCLVKAFNTIAFPSSTGANCPVTIPIKIGK